MNSYAPFTSSTVVLVDMSTASTSLLTGMYELTMLQGALASGAALWRSVFKLFGRRLPGSCCFGVVASTGRLLGAIETFTFTPTQIDFLHRTGTVSDEALDLLRGYRFSGTIRGYAEGGRYFTGSPLLAMGGTFAETYALETLALSVYNYDYAVAVAVSRATIATHGRPCVDFGARQTHEQTAVTAARASVVGGFVRTSNLEAGLLYGIPTVGTSAHSFTFLHDTEEEAFVAQAASLGPNATILVNTYDIATSVGRAVKAARVASGEFGVACLDFGDLVAEALKVCAQLDALGATSARVTVINDLDEHAITALGAAPVDSYGVDAKLVMGSGRPTAALVYKLVEHEGADGATEGVVRSFLGGKSIVGDRKWAGHIPNSEDTAAEGLVVVFSSQDEGMSAPNQIGTRPLQVLLVDGGQTIEEHRGKEILSTTAKRHRMLRAELPYDAQCLSDGEPALPTRHVDLNGRSVTRR